ncbi:hypothetical protein HNQ08_002760 [Deinococcus humi]|uniref:Endonuclease NucS C-terminal domain-containing protein n=2 Tax=Deinococcus humi TaxID=662880 RepID=A0A7W8JXV5_9DEIO|nr:hypothetical protein [Deinococcus humi]
MKQMQDALVRHPELIEPGLTVLDRELLIDSGGIDLYARDAQGRSVVVEPKRGRATQDGVSQLGRDVATVQKSGIGTVWSILAAPSITAPALNRTPGDWHSARLAPGLMLLHQRSCPPCSTEQSPPPFKRASQT